MGRPGYPPELVVRALLLALWYRLCDPELEEALADRLSFRRFVGLSLQDAVPDETTLCPFRASLAADGLAERVMAEICRQPDGHGLIRTALPTPASTHDSEPADGRVQGDEAAVYADKACDNKARRVARRPSWAKDRIMHKAQCGKPPPLRQTRRNRLPAILRSPIERTFGIWKRRYGIPRRATKPGEEPDATPEPQTSAPCTKADKPHR